MVGILSGAIILSQSLVPGAAKVMSQLIKLNSTMMPLRYLWVFAAYIALRKARDKYRSDYVFSKHQGMAYFFGVWCFLITGACCLLGIYSTDPFALTLNIVTPVVLVALGMILPTIKNYQDKKAEEN